MKERRNSNSNKKCTTAAIAAGVSTAALGYVGYKTGIAPDFLNSTIEPTPPTLPAVVDGMVAVNEGIRVAAPVAAIGAGGLAVYYTVAGLMDKKARALNTFSRADYAGTDEAMQPSSRLSGKLNTLKKGTGVAALAIVLTSATSGVEHEVSNGPLRPIDAVTDLVSQGDSDTMAYVLQGSHNTFMDDSYIEKKRLDPVVADAASHGIPIIPFKKELLNINDTSAIQISLPDALFESIIQTPVDASCDTIPVIVDETVKKSVGDTISINGVPAQVAQVKEGMAQMNRSIAIVASSDMECLQKGTDTSYFGAMLPESYKDEVSSLLAKHDMSELAVVNDDFFKENNRDFWRANGTPILLQLIAYIAIFGGLAAAGERKNALQRNVSEIGMLNAMGIGMTDMRKIEDRRALRETAKATLVAIPAVPLVAGAFNAAVSGMEIGVGPREITVGSAITLGAKMLAGRRAVGQFEKKLNLAQAVKG